MRVYIAGPMRGIPDFNFPAFDAAAEYWRSKGWEVISPADHDREVLARGEELNMREIILWDLNQVANCNFVSLLPGWENSSGAAVEIALAKFLNIEIGEITDAVH